MVAVERGHEGVVRALLEVRPGIVNDRDNNGRTALM